MRDYAIRHSGTLRHYDRAGQAPSRRRPRKATSEDLGRMLVFAARLHPDLGPFVEAGSYIVFHAGSNARWRYLFDGNSMTNIDEEPAPWYGR